MPLTSAAKKVIIIFFVTAVALFISLPHEFSLFGRGFTRPNLDINAGRIQLHKSLDLVLGLDLAGGSHLVFEADVSKLPQDKRSDAIASLRNVIERRVNFFGVSEPNVQASSFEGKERIIVELPGVKDTNTAKDIIGKTAELVFAEVEGASDSANLVPTNLTGADLVSAREVFDNQTGKPA
ncbi:MAG TPA: hypothetical protein VI728_00555, partial [Syntrophales bacterium]|nr:hypothetical protein [Syntrophales bacterium]